MSIGKLQLKYIKVACLQNSLTRTALSALAFDQRGALKRLMAQCQTEEPTVAQNGRTQGFGCKIELTKYASSIFSTLSMVSHAKALAPNAGLLLV